MSLACLQCRLSICNEKSPECAYRIPIRITRAATARRRYWKDPQAERDRVAKWQKANADKVREKQRRYDKKKREAHRQNDVNTEYYPRGA